MSLNPKVILEAIKQVKERSKKRTFNQSIELIVNLRDIDMKKPEARIQENVELPHAPRKEAKVCVFASGELALKAKKAGAELVVGKAELEGLATDKKRQKQLARDHDAFLAETTLMPLVGKTLGPVLGPRGKMPKPVLPKMDIKAQIRKALKTVSFRTRGQPIIQCSVGKEDMKAEEITENVIAVVGRIERKLKRGLKNIGKIYLKSTMGPTVEIKL